MQGQGKGRSEHLHSSPKVYSNHMQLDDQTIVVLAGAAVVLVIVVAVTISRKVSQRRLDLLAPAFELGTAKLAGSFSGTIVGIYRGYTCQYRIEPASQYSPGGAILRVIAISQIKWSAYVAHAASRMLQSIGLLQDVEIGDESLDDHLRITASDPGFLISSLRSDSPRQALRSIANLENFNNLEASPKHVQIQWRPRKKTLDEDPDIVRQRLEATVSLLVALGTPPG